MVPQEIITRRTLPHWFVPGAAHFVTYRLFGTLPRSILDELRREKEKLLKQIKLKAESKSLQRVAAHKRLFSMYDEYLDQANGVRWLEQTAVAAMVPDN